MIVFAVVVLAILSVSLSFWSLRNIKRMGEMHEAKEDLKKHRVVFQRDSPVSSSE